MTGLLNTKCFTIPGLVHPPDWVVRHRALGLLRCHTPLRPGAFVDRRCCRIVFEEPLGLDHRCTLFIHCTVFLQDKVLHLVPRVMRPGAVFVDDCVDELFFLLAATTAAADTSSPARPPARWGRLILPLISVFVLAAGFVVEDDSVEHVILPSSHDCRLCIRLNHPDHHISE